MSAPCPRFDHHTQLTDEDRYRVYAELRGCPGARSEQSGGFWVLSGFEEVAAAAEDWRTYSSAAGVLLPAPEGRRGRQVALEQDPPDHTPYRKLYAELLSRPRVRAIEADIRRVASDRLAELAASGSGDFIAHVAAPVPIETLAMLLGFAPDVTAQLRDLAVAELARVNRSPAAPAARPAFTLMDLLRAQMHDRRANPRDDFVTLLVNQNLPELGMLSFLVGAVLAGHETTLIAASNLAYQLGLEPGLQQRLRSQPELIGRAVNESLRHRSPVQNFVRTLTSEVVNGEATMAAGDKVMLLFAAANRDPQRYAEPDRFDLDRYVDDREASRHLAYGSGVHRCVGAFLADVELNIIAEELLRYELTLLAEPTFSPTTFGAFLTIDELPVTLNQRR